MENTPAEGEPRIDGIPEAGQTLSADTTGISDVDGLEEATFQYQWIADDADIAGATGSTYTLTSEHLGQAIRVRVAFTDDGGNEETLTSEPTVVPAGLQLQAATVDDATLTLTYNEELDTSVSPPKAAFAVNVNGSSRSLSGVAVGQSIVLLLLSSGGGGRGHGDGGLHRSRRPRFHPGHPGQEGGLLQRAGGHERHCFGQSTETG